MSNGNPFAIDIGNPLAGLGQLAQQYHQRSYEEEQQAKQLEAQQAKQQEIKSVLDRGNVTEISQYMAANPQFAKGLESAFGFQTEQTRQNMADSAFRILSGEDPKQVIEDRAAFVSQQGGDPSQTLAALNKSPEELQQSAKVMLTQFGTPQQIKAATDLGLVGTGEEDMTPYQKARLKLDEKGLALRELEVKARQEDNVNKRKSLNNRIKKQRMDLQTQELKILADNKGGPAQKMLRDASEGDKLSLTFARRMADSNKQLVELEETIDPTNRIIGFIAGSKGLTSEAANRMAGPEEQAYAAAASDYVTAQLRKESGAAIGADEFERKYRELFPMPGDTPEQVALKRERRAAGSVDMQNLSGGLYNEFYGEGAQVEQAVTQEQQPTQQYTEGQTARNPQTGQVITYRGGQWQ